MGLPGGVGAEGRQLPAGFGRGALYGLAHPLGHELQRAQPAALDRHGRWDALGGAVAEKTHRDAGGGLVQVVVAKARLDPAGVGVGGGQTVGGQLQVGGLTGLTVGPGDSFKLGGLAVGALGGAHAGAVPGRRAGAVAGHRHRVERVGDGGDQRQPGRGGAAPGHDEVLLRFGPFGGGGLAGFREVVERELAAESGQVFPAQGGDGEVDVGEFHIVEVGAQIVGALADAVPVLGEAEAVVAVAAHTLGVGPVGAVGDGLPRSAVDAEFDPLPFAGPAPDQFDPALVRALGGRFQHHPGVGRRRGVGRDRGLAGEYEVLLRFGPAHLGRIAGGGEVAQGVLRPQAGQKRPAQGGDREVDVGEGHAVGEGAQVVDPVADFAPVLGEAKAVVAVAAGGGGVGSVGAVGDGLRGAAVDAEFHRRASQTQPRISPTPLCTKAPGAGDSRTACAWARPAGANNASIHPNHHPNRAETDSAPRCCCRMTASSSRSDPPPRGPGSGARRSSGQETTLFDFAPLTRSPAAVRLSMF